MANGAVIMGLSSQGLRKRVARACPNFHYLLDRAHGIEELGRKVMNYDFCITDTQFDNPRRYHFEQAIKIYLGMWKNIQRGCQALVIVTPDELYDRGLELKLPVMRYHEFMQNGVNEFFESVRSVRLPQAI